MRTNALPKILIGLLAVVFIFHQGYSAVYKPITTQSAEYYTATDGLNITGFVIRKEHLVETKSSDVLHFAVQNGERVAKGGTVADLYDSTDASATVLKIEEIKQKIKNITEIQSYNDVQASDIDLVNTKIRTAPVCSADLGQQVFMGRLCWFNSMSLNLISLDGKYFRLSFNGADLEVEKNVFLTRE